MPRAQPLTHFPDQPTECPGRSEGTGRRRRLPSIAPPREARRGIADASNYVVKAGGVRNSHRTLTIWPSMTTVMFTWVAGDERRCVPDPALFVKGGRPWREG